MDIKTLVNPLALDLPEYDQKHVTVCWENDGFVQRLMSNESSHPPLTSVREAIANYISRVNWYPEDACYALNLRNKLAAYTGVSAENITLSNGSMEMLDLVLHTFIDPRLAEEIIMPAPDYSAYVNRAKLYGGCVRLLPCGEDVDQIRDPILQAIGSQTKLILFSRPNNPIGKLVPNDDLRDLLNQNKLIVVDEAYVELAQPGASVAAWVKDYENLIVLRTFSKGFGLAGLRLGYIIAHPEIIRFVNKVRHIFNVNLLAIIGGEAVLDDLENALQVVDEIRQTRDWLQKALSTIPGLRVIPSEANFLMVNVAQSRKKAQEYVDYLLSRGFFVRDFSKKFGLSPDQYFRITIGLRDDMERLVSSLEEFVSSY